MKKLLLGAATAAGFFATGAAMAADLPPAPAYKAPAVVAPMAYNWTGFYIGANAGGAWGTFDPSTAVVFSPTGYFATTSTPAITTAGAQVIKPNGFTGGFEAGVNWQAGNFVFGVEGDIESFRLSGNATSGPVLYPCCAPTSFTVMSNASTSWLATGRGRLGVAANNWLFYATGGVAFTNLNANFNFTDTFATAAESASISGTKVGWTAGGGIEAGLWQGWSVKAEYLYVDFGSVSVNSTNLTAFTPPIAFPTNVFTHSVDLKASIARIGLNYRFGGGPVVAAY
jgi:outer membrane immunogenic protein